VCTSIVSGANPVATKHEEDLLEFAAAKGLTSNQDRDRPRRRRQPNGGVGHTRQKLVQRVASSMHADQDATSLNGWKAALLALLQSENVPQSLSPMMPVS